VGLTDSREAPANFVTGEEGEDNNNEGEDRSHTLTTQSSQIFTTITTITKKIKNNTIR
jgi:hypothetical protein